MRKIFTILSFAALSAVNAQYDGFNYSTPLTVNGWTTHSGSNEISLKTTGSDNGNSLSYEGLPKSVGNRIELIPAGGNVSINKSFSNPSTTVAYASFLMKVVDLSKNVPANTTTTAPGGFFFSFSANEGVSVSDGTQSVSKVGIRKGSVDNTYNISLLNVNGGTIPAEEIFGKNPKDYNVGETYFVVIKYDMAGTVGKSSIWVNTLSEGELLHSSEAGTSDKLSQVSSVIVRQRANLAPGVELDEVRLGTTWKEVTESTLSTGEVNNKTKHILSNTLVLDQFKVLSNQKTSVEVYSLTGQLVKTAQVTPQNAVNVSNLPSGVYIVKVVEGTQTYTQKIVKK